MPFVDINLNEILGNKNSVDELMSSQRCTAFEWASIKPGTWNIPEHSGTSRNMKKIFFNEKIIN